MKPAEIFRKTLKAFLSEKPRGFQGGLADALGIDRANMSHYLSGRDTFSEDRRIKIAEHLGFSYEEFIAFGRKLLSDGAEIKAVKNPLFLESSETPPSALAADYIEELKQQVKDLRSERDGLRADKAYWISQSEKWEAEKAELKEERAEFKKEIAELKERIRSLEAQQAMTAEYDVKKSAS